MAMAIQSGQYIIINCLSRNVLTIPQNAPDSGAIIYCQKWSGDPGYHQLWEVKTLSQNNSNSSDEDQYSIRSIYPQRYAYCDPEKARATLSGRIGISIWHIKKESGGKFSIVIPHSHKVLTCNSIDENSQIVLKPSEAGNRNVGQYWEFHHSLPEDNENEPINNSKNYNSMSPFLQSDCPQRKTSTKNETSQLSPEMMRIADYIRTGQWAEALTETMKYIPSLDSIESTTTLRKVCETLCINGHYDEVIFAIDNHSRTVDNQIPSKRIKAQVLHLKGIAAKKSQSYHTAEALYTEAITLDALDSVFYADRSESRAAMGGKLEAALIDAEESIRLDPTSGLGYHCKGVVLDLLWNSNDAENVHLRERLKTQESSKFSNHSQPIPPTNARETPAPINPTPSPAKDQTNPPNNTSSNVFFTIKIGDTEVGRIVFKLYDDWAPLSARNFRELATGIHKFGYKGSRFDQIGPHACFGGDIIEGNGTQGESIYTPPRPVEKHRNKKFKSGMLYLATTEQLIDSRFVISMKTPDPPSKFGSPIGEVIGQLDVVKEICASKTQPTQIVISDCGCIP